MIQSHPPLVLPLTEQGRALLKRLEGQVKRNGKHVVYKDAVGKPTIGWGHLIKVQETFPVDGISDAEADALLTQDLARFERAVGRSVEVSLNFNQRDALIIFAFNIGVGGFKKSTAVRRLNAGDYEGAAQAMAMWHKGRDPKTGKKRPLSGLVKRRVAEIVRFMR